MFTCIVLKIFLSSQRFNNDLILNLIVKCYQEENPYHDTFIEWKGKKTLNF